ncbi:DUF2142 domain-containing protein [Nakamurella deserti]|uniref:DUF2142 domain-containing protein n=1 Tax=Nakamurella deserti TaxID=2164074 RepID=UPI000DBE0D26|nr:DUF2142 domain-containing protein [Nakamurella deserti]
MHPDATDPAEVAPLPLTPEAVRRAERARPVYRNLSARAAFWAATALFALIGTIWSLASPVLSAPDEAAHAIKAAAVVRGQFLGDETGLPAGRGTVEVPALFVRAAELPLCYAPTGLGALQPDGSLAPSAIPAACQPELTGDLDTVVPAVTSAVRYNPLYYLVAGVPSLFGSSMATLYWMRIAGAVAAAVLLGMAVRTAAELGRSFWPMAALLVAVTPTVVFLTGSINPQAVEIPAAVLAWTALLALVLTPHPAYEHRRLARLTVGVAVVANVRGLGPQFVLVIVAAVLLTARWAVLRNLLRRRRTQVYLALTGFSVLVAVAWNQLNVTLATNPEVLFPMNTGAFILDFAVGKTDEFIRQSLGTFGWLTAQLPMWSYLCLGAALLLVILVGFAAAGARERLAMAGVGLLVLVLPTWAEYTQARYINTFWQGRYALPLAVGVPLIAGFVMRRAGRSAVPDGLSRRLLVVLGLVVAALQTVAVIVDLRRYVTGIGRDATWFSWPDDAWLPPVHPYLLVAVDLAVGSALVAVLVRAANRPPTPVVAAPTPPPGPPAAPAAPPARRVPAGS